MALKVHQVHFYLEEYNMLNCSLVKFGNSDTTYTSKEQSFSFLLIVLLILGIVSGGVEIISN